MRENLFRRVVVGLSAVGPGLFLIGYNIGTGSITTMAKAGANYGMMLFWALVLSCVFTYILMVAYGQLTLVTGKTALNNVRHNFTMGTALATYILVALVLGELLSVMGVMGIVVELLQEGLRLWGDFHVSPFALTLVLAALIYLLFWFGRYKEFEKVLTVFVILMGLCFILVFFLVEPDYRVILSGMMPRIPDEPGAFALVAAMAGTTCSAAVFIVRSTVIAEKGWTITDLAGEKKDAAVSAGMMLFLSGIIMAVSAGTLHIMGSRLDNTVEMIRLFEPLGGEVAASILILGVAGAGLSTVFPIILIAPWLISDITGRPRDIHSPMFRALGLAGLACSFGFLIIEETPPGLTVFSQAFQACILPAVAIPAFLLVRDEKIMKEEGAGKWMQFGLILVILFSIMTTYLAVRDLFRS